VEADARAVIPRLFAPGSLAGIHLQFPDPWWKRAHRKRAILTPAFATLLLERTAPGGVFDLRTDVQSRAEEMLATLEAAGWRNPLGPGSFHTADPDEVPSSRERRYLESGEPVYRARLTRP
jgi:tRNA (guanine-N7-)-methyltransferase